MLQHGVLHMCIRELIGNNTQGEVLASFDPPLEAKSYCINTRAHVPAHTIHTHTSKRTYTHLNTHI